jgi:alkanesulfonate monooxygenase SsuD/methylene tetrahydromethanopterin reductase-like flavin-dependent oxidoreductase (luciferase family)
MRFSVYLNPQTSGPERDVAQIDTSIEHAIRATEAGFDGVVLTEHHVSGYNTFGDNFMMAAHLAPQVRRGTRFLLATAIPQLHHPMRLAQLCNLLDVLCRGEVIIGMGAGGSPLEFNALGRNPGDRHREMMEVLDVVEKALDRNPKDPPYKWSTTYESGFLSTRIMPTSYGPRPKFARATQSDEGVIWTARKGWYLMTARAPLDVIASRFRLYREELGNSGLDADAIAERMDWSSLARQVIIADTDQEADAHATRILERLAEGVRRTWSAPTPLGDKAPTFTKDYLGISAEDPVAFREGAMLVGSPETITKKLEACVKAGVPHIMLCFNYGHMTREEADRQLDLFLAEVYPRFKAEHQRFNAGAQVGALSPAASAL